MAGLKSGMRESGYVDTGVGVLIREEKPDQS